MTTRYEYYAYIPTRSEDAVRLFLDKYAPVREPTQGDLSIPEFAENPKFRTDDVVLHIKKICKLENATETGSVYFNTTKIGPQKSAMIFFAESGSMFLGVDMSTSSFETLKQFCKSLHSDAGYISQNVHPGYSIDGFRNNIRNADIGFFRGVI